MLYSSLAFLVGISALQTLAVLPAGGCIWLAGALPLLAFGHWLPRGAGFAVAGFLWAWWFAFQALQVSLPSSLEGIDIRVEGRVRGLPERFADDKRRFLFVVQRYQQGDTWKPLELPVRLSWYRQALDIAAGERWSLRVRLKRPRGYSNPGGFDYERWLFARGIRATGYVRHSELNRRLDPNGGWPVARWREKLAQRIRQCNDDPAASALLTALAVGVRTAISRDQWRVLRATGTSHLIAISGLHVGLVAGLVFLLMRKIWAAWGATQRLPAPRIAAVAAMLAAFVYAMLAGFEVPAQRALIMVCVWMLCRHWLGSPAPGRVLGIALWLVLLLDPLVVLSAGFWLSFAAVAWILYLSAGRFGRLPRWRRICSIQFGLVLGLTPLLWVWFHELSLIAPLANLVAIPWIGVAVVPLLLSGVALLAWWPTAGELLVAAAAYLLELLWQLLEGLAALPLTVVALPTLRPGLLVLLAVGLVLALAARGTPLRPAALVLVLMAITYRPERPASGDLRFTLLDVGQGLAAVIETRRHVLVYDAGPAFRGGLDTGEAVVAPYLVHLGQRRVDTLVISHSDNDHSGGGKSLFERLRVMRIDSGEPGELHWARSRRCRDGQRWVWDQVTFAYLAPLQAATGNNASCVLRVETGDGQVLLLPGDIESAVERRLLAADRGGLAADVLVAPHHGSRTSSTPAFVDAVRPRLVLFATGYRNRFGFPKPQVQQRYRDIGAKAYETAHSGAIEVRLRRGKPPETREYRRLRQRYWQ